MTIKQNSDNDSSRQHEQFHCHNCGRCCSHIRGQMSKEEYELIRQVGYGGLPLIQLVSPDKLSFPLWPDEARKLRSKGQELGLSELRVIPLRAVFDLNTNTALIVTYLFDHDNCPFLQKNASGSSCLAYDCRPLICCQFPFQTPDQIVDFCPGVKDLSASRLDINSLNSEEKKHLFGDSFSAALEMHERMTKSNMKILDLIKQKKIRPAVNYPYEFLLRRISNSKKLDFDEFE